MVNIVVARYNENIDWTKKINHKVTIYNKGKSDIENNHIKLKNIGREGETFLYHIVNNYKNLDDITVFLQGNPFEHLQILVGWRSQLSENEIDIVCNKMNVEINDNSEYSTFYQVLYNNLNLTNNVDTSTACLKYYNEKYDKFTVCPGAQYIVPKEYILSRPLEFWKGLQQAMFNNEELNGYCQEMLWYLAFKHKMNYNVGNHDYEKAKCINYGLHHTPTSYFTFPI